MRTLPFAFALLVACGASHPRVSDVDDDGIPDDRDQCVRPGTDGCQESTSAAMGGDRDGDGIPDRADGCPDVTGPASSSGCPARDPDGA